MAGDRTPAAVLDLVQRIVSSAANAGGCDGCGSVFKKDCADLVRRIALLTHFLEEIKDFEPLDWCSDLIAALESAMRLLSVAFGFHSVDCSGGAAKRISFQFQCVTWKLEKALGKIPFNRYDISEEVQEQVALLRTQLRRAIARYGSMNSKMVFSALLQQLKEEAGKQVCGLNKNTKEQKNMDGKVKEEIKKFEAVLIPDDFRCPISLELMRDPVTVATGQTYERAYIQRWIDGGNLTCPKTQQRLENLTLTPNHVLRRLINQWCAKHDVKQPAGLANGRIKKGDGSFCDVSGEMAGIQAVVRKLSSRCLEERRAAVTEIRSLSKRSTDNRILIAEAGAIPVLVNLLTTEDVTLQENAVTSILNLSIHENNKPLIMLAGAIPSIVQILRAGSMEARENAAATIFSLSLAEENKIIIGASGAIPALIELLQNGSLRGRKDAATALFNLCIYQGNKGRAVRAGIITALLKMLTDSRNCMVDEALTILSVLASNHDAKVSIVKASAVPVLIDLLRTGLPRNKENAAAILFSVCKRDHENLACLSRLGAVVPLTELAKNGTERAKRKATSLLEHLLKLQHLQQV